MPKTTKKTSPTKKPASKVNRKTPAASSKTDNRAIRVIVGLVIGVVVLMLTLSCISYIFTGAADQVVMQDEKYSNILGRAGHIVSQVIMSRMGISSFFVLAIGFAVSAVVVLDKPFSRIAMFCAKMMMISVWLSVTLGYFTDFMFTGTWGFRMHEFLTGHIGWWGLLLVLAVFPIVWLIYKMNISPEKLNAMREEQLARKAERQALRDADKLREQEEQQALEALAQPLEDTELSSAVEEDPEYAYSPVDLDEEDQEDPDPQEEYLEDEPAPVITFAEQEQEQTYKIEDRHQKDDIHFAHPEEQIEEEQIDQDDIDNPTTILQEGEVISDTQDGVECTISIYPTEGEIDDNFARSLVEKYGEYDPKLDLSNYQFPSIKMLRKFDNEGINVDKEEVVANRRRIVETLKNYNIEIAHIHSTVGPTVTLYEIIPAPGVRIAKIKNLEDDIALSLSALGIRIMAPIPGKGTIGIEVPNKEPSLVSMNSVIASKKFQMAQMELPIAMGKTISNETLVFDLAKMPHLLMAGATGQGKSVGLNAVITSLLYKKHPSQVKFVLVDPKKVELTLYNKIERHYLAKLPDSAEAIITDNTKVINTLNSLCVEMDMRYELLKNAMVRNIKEYNTKFVARRLNPEKGHRFLPYIVLVVDEFADLIMTAGKEVETPIARLAQLARAIGIHLIIATQRPSVNVITGLIKANFPARIAFRVTSKIDSRTILDTQGADQLIGKGDMLFSNGNELTRVQCAFVDTPEVEEICDFIGSQKGYPSALLLPEFEGEDGDDVLSVDMNDRDSKFEEAARIVVALQQGSASVIQRKMSIGYNRAGRIVDQLEAAGIIGPFKGSKAREVLIQDEASLNRILSNTNQK